MNRFIDVQLDMVLQIMTGIITAYEAVELFHRTGVMLLFSSPTEKKAVLLGKVKAMYH